MDPLVLILVILGLAAVGVLGLLWLVSARRRRVRADIPPSMRPAYSDEELETRVLERYMAWGVVFTLGFAIFLPLYFLREPMRIQAKAEEDFVKTFERGQEQYGLLCAQCHGAAAQGGGALSPYNAGDTWPAPSLNNIAARYADSRTITDVRDLIMTTIRRGRPGTPMPTWGADYGGPLTDQQIIDLTDWILANQVDDTIEADPAVNVSGEDLYQQNCARCHGQGIEGLVGPSLVGVFERHDEETILGILRNGIYLGTGTIMPAWQTAYTYPDGRYADPALQRIVDYLRQSQPGRLPEGSEQYQTPGIGPDPRDAADEAPEGEAPAGDDTTTDA